MRVLYFYRDDTVHDRRFMEAFGNQSVDVIALRLEQRVKKADDWKPPANVSLISWSRSDKPFHWFYQSLLIKEMKDLITRIKPDVIHAGPLDLCTYLAARSGARPLVGMSWGYDILLNAENHFVNRHRIQYALDRTAILLADCLTVSRKAGCYGFPSKQIITFPWGVDLKNFRPGSGKRIRQTLGWVDKIILLSTRSMEKLYGCDILVEAFVKTARLEHRLVLIMLGDGSQKNRLVQRISSAGMLDRVRFMGSIPEKEIAQYFQASDVYISASHSDGSSVSLLQAMACGIPPLVSDIPGNQEWVIPNQNGWLFNDGNSNALSMLMGEAARSPQLRKQYGNEAHKIAKKRANWETNSRELGGVYEWAVNIRRAFEEDS